MIDELILIFVNLILIPLAVLNPDNNMVTTMLIPLFIIDVIYFVVYVMGSFLFKSLEGDNV
ncbi:MAG: hypothetical protein WC415_01870 [Patescibacteria group bacterium]|jgi:hypothetical protein